MDICYHFCETIRNDFKGLTKTQVRNLVYHACEGAFGGDATSKVESQYSGSDKTAFLHHHASFADEEKMQLIVCISDHQLLALLMYPMVSKKSEHL